MSALAQHVVDFEPRFGRLQGVVHATLPALDAKEGDEGR